MPPDSPCLPSPHERDAILPQSTVCRRAPTDAELEPNPSRNHLGGTWGQESKNSLRLYQSAHAGALQPSETTFSARTRRAVCVGRPSPNVFHFKAGNPNDLRILPSRKIRSAALVVLSLSLSPFACGQALVVGFPNQPTAEIVVLPKSVPDPDRNWNPIPVRLRVSTGAGGLPDTNASTVKVTSSKLGCPIAWAEMTFA